MKFRIFIPKEELMQNDYACLNVLLKYCKKYKILVTANTEGTHIPVGIHLDTMGKPAQSLIAQLDKLNLKYQLIDVSIREKEIAIPHKRELLNKSVYLVGVVIIILGSIVYAANEWNLLLKPVRNEKYYIKNVAIKGNYKEITIGVIPVLDPPLR